MEKVKVGDEICIVMFPEKDIDGNEYTLIGGGGTVLKVKENSVIVELFDGAIIEAEGVYTDDFEILKKA